MAKRKDVEKILAQREKELEEKELEATKEMADIVQRLAAEDASEKAKQKIPREDPKEELNHEELKQEIPQEEPKKETPKKEAPKEAARQKKQKKEPKKEAPKEEPEEAPKEEPEEAPKEEEPAEILPAESVVPAMANLEVTVSDNYKLGFGRPRTIDGPGKAFQYFSREYGEWKLTPNYWWATQFGSGDIQVVLVYYKDGKIDHLLTEREAEQYI